MQRRAVPPRPEWQRRVEEAGVVFHSQTAPYWDESACYVLSLLDVQILEEATAELYEMCLAAVQRVLDARRYHELHIPPPMVPLIESSWNDDAPSLYGRFDLRYDGRSAPRLLEFNADTPTSLVEAAVAQWFWLRDTGYGDDQFNSIHERLVATWKILQPELRGAPLFFAGLDDWEDQATLLYLRDTAEQAGLRTAAIPIARVGWHAELRRFVDERDRPITSIFKLYPWEWLAREAFGAHLPEMADAMQWIEPAWKMVLSNKGILPILWELYPRHPLLLEAHREPGRLRREYARKPLLSREGANVTLVRAEGRVESPGRYGEEGFVYQELAPLPRYDGRHPVLGSWVIGGEAAGVGIRESDGLITDNLSCFVPHCID